MSCPRTFYPLYVGEDIKVCVSNDYELGYAHAVNFAGFYSCSVGNPLAHSAPSLDNRAQWPNLCPSGYAQHLITVDDGCVINFCVQAGAFKPSSLTVPQLPPFFQNPIQSNNVTGELFLVGMQRLWAKNEEGKWEQVDLESEEGQALLRRLNATQLNQLSAASSDSQKIPRGGVAALSIFVTIVLGVAIVVAVFVGHRIFKRRKGGNKAHSDIISNVTNEQEDPTKSA